MNASTTDKPVVTGDDFFRYCKESGVLPNILFMMEDEQSFVAAVPISTKLGPAIKSMFTNWYEMHDNNKPVWALRLSKQDIHNIYITGTYFDNFK